MFIHYLAVLWQVLTARFVTKALPINSIDSKWYTKKLKSSRTCLIGYSGFISLEWFLIARGRTHTHTHLQTF